MSFVLFAFTTSLAGAQGSWEAAATEAKAAFGQRAYAQAQAKWEEALKQAETSHDVDPGVITCLTNLALVNDKQGKALEAERLLELSMRTLEGMVGPTSPRFADSMPDLAWLYESHGKLDKAEVLFKRAIEIKQRAYGKDDARVAESLDDYARFLRKESRGTEASEIEERARNIRGKVNT